MGISLREALVNDLTAKGLRSADTPPERLYEDDWFRITLGGRNVKVIKLKGLIESVAIHDVHHLLTGYGTDVQGEAEIAAWELASGGCSRHWLMWLDRLVALITVALFYPRASWAAAKRGWQERNLYGASLDPLLRQDLETVRARLSRRAEQ